MCEINRLLDHLVLYLYTVIYTLQMAYQWLYGGLAVLAKRKGAVVHDALVIIFNAKVGDVCARVFVKVVLVAIRDVLPVDLHVLVALRGALLVIEAKGVQQLVHHNTVGDTFGRIQIEYLATLTTPHAGPAAGVVALDEQPMLVALLIRPEAYAAAFVVLLERLEDDHGLVGRCAS